MQHITSRDNERVKHACKLAGSAALRAEEGLFFAEGRRLCLDLAQSSPPAAAFFTQKMLDAHPGVQALAAESYLVDEHVAEKLSETRRSQGLYCLFPMPRPAPEELDAADGLILCEAVQDPANVGAVLRSAAAFGFGGAVLSAGCADPFAPKALRASAGAVLRLPVATGAAFPGAVAALAARGVTVYAAALENARPLAEAKPAGPFALLVGNEGAGLTAEAVAAAGRTVYIPMHRGVESLNAAVAASVLMYHFKNCI